MPEKMTKMNGGYQVKGPHGVHMKKGTKANAEAQVRLLNAVEHGWKPTGAPAKHHSPPTNPKFDSPDKY
jgi:hypothetical protein